MAPGFRHANQLPPGFGPKQPKQPPKHGGGGGETKEPAAERYAVRLDAEEDEMLRSALGLQDAAAGAGASADAWPVGSRGRLMRDTRKLQQLYGAL